MQNVIFNRKKKEELSKLKKKYETEEIEKEESSSDEDEDEDGELLTPDSENDFLKILPLIANKDSSIYNPSKTFFKDETNQNSNDKNDISAKSVMKSEKKKPLYLRDYISQQLIKKAEKKRKGRRSFF